MKNRLNLTHSLDENVRALDLNMFEMTPISTSSGRPAVAKKESGIILLNKTRFKGWNTIDSSSRFIRIRHDSAACCACDSNSESKHCVERCRFASTHMQWRRHADQTACAEPNITPAPVVITIASAPQRVTLQAPTRALLPPIWATCCANPASRPRAI